MKCNTGEYNDPDKIDINVENDEKGNLKRFFEKGLSALLRDPFFLLLYIPENGERMKVIRPASESYHRKRIIERINEANRIPSFYYALSHLWGLTEDNRYLWNEIGEHMDDEEGQPLKPVSMRPEKRDALLALLKGHPDSYWWIDVLCARTDTPLDIMGDIYACCLECIAMIDCETTLISKVSDAVEEVKEIKERIGNTDLTYQQIRQFKALQLVEPLYTFFQSQWWQRVWTWQEMALPCGHVRFTAETDIHRLQAKTITLNELLEFKSLLRTFYNLRHELVIHEYDGMVPYAVSRRVNDIYFAKESNSHCSEDGKPGLNFLMISLRRSKRRCYDPADYVYGVLGMMQIKIPRMTDANAAWRHLLSELDDLYPLDYGRWIDHADEIDLRKVENIGEVYSKLYWINYENYRHHRLL